MGVRNDMLSLIYLMNKEARVTVKTPVGDTDPILLTNLVKQGTVLGPVLNNCSLNKMSTYSTGYNFGSVQLKPLEFVDDIADPSREKALVLLQVIVFWRLFSMKSEYLSQQRNVSY